MIAFPRGRSSLALVALLCVTAMLVAASSVHAASYSACALSEADQDPPGSKPTYNLLLKQQRTRCTTARRVMAAFHRCRPASGFTCRRKVLSNWTCSGRKDSSMPKIFYGTFTCTWGPRRVKSTYQQNT